MMSAKEQRDLAAKCLELTLNGDYKGASKARQMAYALDPPGSIGVDWNDFDQIWKFDKRYIDAMEKEDFSDLKNSKTFVSVVKSGLYVDNLFNFRDMWGVDNAIKNLNETINCPLLDKFLLEKDWPRENKLHIYCQTKIKNINAIIYFGSTKIKKTPDPYTPQHFSLGEYDLGFRPNTPQWVIDGRKKWLKRYNLFEDMQAANIEKFPKTFQTFEKHCLANDDKYKLWVSEYQKDKENSK